MFFIAISDADVFALFKTWLKDITVQFFYFQCVANINKNKLHKFQRADCHCGKLGHCAVSRTWLVEVVTWAWNSHYLLSWPWYL